MNNFALSLPNFILAKRQIIYLIYYMHLIPWIVIE